jgi:hypothetical protein
VALADELAQRIEKRLGEPLDAVLAAWANATRKEAPRVTGALQSSVHAERSSPTEGALVMRFYGQIVAERMPALSPLPANVRARARYAQQVGRQVEHPNPFYQRAWESDEVQRALARFADLIFQRS